MFDDVLDANRRYATEFHDPGVSGHAAKGLVVLTCIDSRLDPLAILGLKAGDAKIIRNAGARVTNDALRSLVITVNVLSVDRVCVVHHTDCAMAGHDDGPIRDAVAATTGADATGWDFHSMPDELAAIHADLELIRTCELLPDDLVVGAFVFDVHTGRLTEVEA